MSHDDWLLLLRPALFFLVGLIYGGAFGDWQETRVGRFLKRDVRSFRRND